jgi:tetratricopeptide (TPR) repeat protein
MLFCSEGEISHHDTSSNSNSEFNAQLELAILYSNRSLVRLSMSKLHESAEDAECAVQCDPTYIKGHWRHGQACIALGNYTDGLVSFTKALELEPSNKALMREVNVTKEKIVEMEEKLLLEEETTKQKNQVTDAAAAAAAAAAKNVDKEDLEMEDASNMSTKPSPKTKQEQSPPSLPEVQTESTTSNVDTTSTETVTTNSSLFTKSDHVRGYKIRSDGSKTSYFDREISEDAKKLIGDIAPKKLEVGAASSSSAPMMVENNGGSNEGTSAWNKAGKFGVLAYCFIHRYSHSSCH